MLIETWEFQIPPGKAIEAIEQCKLIAEAVKKRKQVINCRIFQPDTGPILFPDLDREPEDLVAGFELAFVAYNSPDWAEFIVRVPTPLTKEISVYHFSRSVRLDTKTQLFAIGA